LLKRQCLHHKVNPLFPFADYRLSCFKKQKAKNGKGMQKAFVLKVSSFVKASIAFCFSLIVRQRRFF